MSQMKKRGKQFIIPAIVLSIVIVVAVMAFQQPAVSASSPPPDVPDFEGEEFSATLDDSVEIPRETVKVDVVQQDWQVIFSADFEGVNWNIGWTNLSVNNNPYKYDAVEYNNPLDPSSDRVAWSVGSAAPPAPVLDPNTDGYPPNVDAWLIAGPFDLSNAIDAQLNFEYSLDAKIGDSFGIGVSTDGSNYTGLQVNDGGNGSWTSAGLNLISYVGDPQVWIAYRFTSDDSPNNKNRKGAFLDNVEFRVRNRNKSNLPIVVYSLPPTPTPSPTPTATPPSGGDFFQGFTNSISPWEARMWTEGAAFNISHDGGCDDDRCGFLNMLVNNEFDYVIASPLALSRPRPYNIETEAKIRSPREDQDQYSIVFGANYNGGACPSTSFDTCFTQYLELRVRYRDDGNKEWIEYKLKQVDGIDSDNQNFGPDLIDWEKVDVNEDGFVEWDITVSQSGNIRIAADDKEVGRVDNDEFDVEYLDNPYFGLMVRNGDVENAEVKFDYIKIDWNSLYNQLFSDE